ncbi:dockerin type I domain-containing protein [Ruminiclostridium papyrosolvens]|uniref:Probable pectate lyase C n=1 Tax=Ruminiclostridium papyrosolvens C7 TaxID=1330534 RepID=U4R1I5_9FIRM|nr:dockerin type I domain-containing protein [Ruminiclostridium papyrosolvens]EPR12073.1 pectate lyase [Ruminiclostridium papyrosolvens C7]
MLRKMKIFLLAGAVMAQALVGLGAVNTVHAAENGLFGLVGFATMNGGTTGGAGGKEVTVKSATEMSDLLNQRKKDDDTSPLVIKVATKLTGTGAIGVKEVSNVSIIGVGSSGELEGVGLNIVKASNIIVQNLKIHHTLAPTDCIGIENSKNVWIDHCELYNMIGDCNGDGKVDEKGDITGGDVDWYDGLLDCKKDSAYITVSWNYFHDSFKTSLVGSSDSDNYDRKMTYHHNVFKNLKERLPSYRFGTGHIFSNYYADVWNSAVNSRMGAQLKVESNYFERVGSGAVNEESGLASGPIGSYNSDSIGYYDVKDNTYVSCKGNQPTISTCNYTPPYEYTGYLTTANRVKELVTQYAGVGKLDGSNPTNPTDPTEPTDPQDPGQTVKCGDINGDGNIDTIDFATLKMYLLGQPVTINIGASDLDSDNAVTILDLAVLKKYLLGQVATLPVNNGNTNPTEGDITIEPTGSMTLQQAIDSIKPGKTIYLKSGTYSFFKTVTIAEGNNGNEGSMKNIAVLGNEKAVLDFSGMAFNSSNRGVILAGNYWNIKGIKIQKAGDNGMLLAGNNNIVEDCEFYANSDSGLQLSRFNSNYSTIAQWPSNNTIRNCYSHSNYDPDNGEDADGFAAKLTCGQGNKFIGCISKYNVDDGWDLYTKDDTGPIGSVYFENCEASYNGKTENGSSTTDSDGNGFKLGGSGISVNHKLVNCKAFNNKKHGFTWNSNPGILTLIGCQASGNSGNDFEKVANQ